MGDPGTRILVSVIQRQLEDGMSAEEVIGQWRGKVSLAAVAQIIDADVKDPAGQLTI